MAYKDLIEADRQKWTGRAVVYEGKKYTVVDVDYNGGILINKPAEFTETTAVSRHDLVLQKK